MSLDSYTMSKARRPTINWLAHLLGARYSDGRVTIFPWGEFSTSWGFALAVCLFEDHASLHIHLLWPNLFIKLPGKWHEPEEMMEVWGFSIYLYDIHLGWGNRTKILHFPWDWQHVRHEVYCIDGLWQKGQSSRLGAEKAEEIHPLTLSEPYRYVNRDGVVQNLIATYHTEEREWRWRWFTWLPWPRKISRSISIDFSEEVGSERGSWKGGVLGCGFTMERGETPQECLRRMERTRRFDR